MEITKEEKMKTTVFFIEANSFEILQLWKECKEETKWEEDSMGFSQVIGYLDEHNEMKPVNVSFTFAKIFGKRICFYDVISRFSDSQMVENYLETNYPVKYDNGTRRAMTNSMNFHNARIACSMNS